MAPQVRNLSVLDTKQSHILNFPLTVKQQLWFIFVLPSFFISVFYILDIATDLAVGCALLDERHIWAGIVTLLLPYTAAIISYIHSIANPPCENEFKVLVIWFLTETAAFLLYPVRPIQYFSERIFWSIEAIRLEDPLREEALIAFEKTRMFSIENYLFFQGIVHAGSQMLFQLVLVLLKTSSNPQTEEVQVVCILSSMATLSMIAMTYHRYETQVRGGRQEIWRVYDQEPLEEEPEMIPINTNTLAAEVVIPRRKKWTKIMEEDDPLGKGVLFLFWFLFIFGRSLCLSVGALFIPWIVLGVCVAHYIFCLIFILPTTTPWTSKLIIKICLAFVYLFCLIEVGVQLRKSNIFFNLFLVFSLVENLAITIIWSVWSNWSGFWYHYCLYLMGILHCIALILLFVYLKYFQPQIRRIQPTI